MSNSKPESVKGRTAVKTAGSARKSTPKRSALKPSRADKPNPVTQAKAWCLKNPLGEWKKAAEKKKGIPPVSPKSFRPNPATSNVSVRELEVLLSRYSCGVEGLEIRKLAQVIHSEAQNEGVDPLLMMAIMSAESSFKPTAHSPTDDWGLMQLAPGTIADIVKNEKVKREEVREYQTVKQKLSSMTRMLMKQSVPNAMGGIRHFGDGQAQIERKLSKGRKADPGRVIFHAVQGYNAGIPRISKAIDSGNSFQVFQEYPSRIAWILNDIRKHLPEVRKYLAAAGGIDSGKT